MEKESTDAGVRLKDCHRALCVHVCVCVHIFIYIHMKQKTTKLGCWEVYWYWHKNRPTFSTYITSRKSSRYNACLPHFLLAATRTSDIPKTDCTINWYSWVRMDGIGQISWVTQGKPRWACMNETHTWAILNQGYLRAVYSCSITV